jgi:hypothetical protein
MDDIVDDFLRMAQRCERASKLLTDKPIQSLRTAIEKAIESVGKAWSGSWIGYQANVYKADLQPRQAGDHFDTDWGTDEYLSETMGEWAVFTHESICDESTRRSGKVDKDLITATAKEVGRVFDECKTELLPTFDAIISTQGDEVLKTKLEELANLTQHVSARKFIETFAPNQIASSDTRAIQGGRHTPSHYRVYAWVLEAFSYGH